MLLTNGQLEVLVILCLLMLLETPTVASSSQEIIALASWKENSGAISSSYGSTVTLHSSGKVCRRMSTIPSQFSSHIVRGVFRHEGSPPVVDISINSKLFSRVDTLKDLVVQIPIDPDNNTLLYCLMPCPGEAMATMPTLELYISRSTRKLLERQHESHISVPGVIGTVLISLTTLTIVTALCVTRLFRALKRSPPVQPQSSPRIYETSMELKTEKDPIDVKRYMLKELQEVVVGNKIAEGGFGYVYRGMLANQQEVAIKVRSSTSSQGLREFTAELTLLSKVRHPNLVPLLGYCTEGQNEMLVYPYMSNGTLQDRLYGEAAKRKPLDWQTRLSIALGAARGLNFLHSSGPRPIIHRDVKSSNILLDDSMNARVADFGFSRFAPQEDDSLVSVEVRGTTGYLDPEYYMTQVLTTKSDVFSFGVVLLEIVCGREPLNLRRPRPEASLVDWARKLISEANIQAIVDPAISTSYTPEAMWRVVEVAFSSVDSNAARRPDMAGIVKELDDALIIENNASQYMLSMDSIGSFRRSSSIKLPLSAVPFDPSPAFSETLDSPHPR